MPLICARCYVQPIFPQYYKLVSCVRMSRGQPQDEPHRSTLPAAMISFIWRDKTILWVTRTTDNLPLLTPSPTWMRSRSFACHMMALMVDRRWKKLRSCKKKQGHGRLCKHSNEHMFNTVVNFTAMKKNKQFCNCNISRWGLCSIKRCQFY